MSLFPSTCPTSGTARPETQGAGDAGTHSAPRPGSTRLARHHHSEDVILTVGGKFSQKEFYDTCLAEVPRSSRPVCGTFHQFPAEDGDRLFAQTLPGFLFGLKVPEDITVATWPKHARYGPRAGQYNEHFLTPRRSSGSSPGFWSRNSEVGPLIFEFGTFNKGTYPHAASAHSPDYFDLLKSHNTAHALFNAWTRMPAGRRSSAVPGSVHGGFHRRPGPPKGWPRMPSRAAH